MAKYCGCRRHRATPLRESALPLEIVGDDEVFVRIVFVGYRSLRLSELDHRALIPLTNAVGDGRRDHFAAPAITNDTERAVVQACAHRRIHQDKEQLLARHEIEALFALQFLGQAMLFDELIDFRGARFRRCRVLPLLVELLIPRDFRGLCLLGTKLLLGRGGGLMSRRRRLLPLRLAGLFLGNQAGLQKLFSQTIAHARSRVCGV